MRKFAFLSLAFGLLSSCNSNTSDTVVPLEGIPLEYQCFYTNTPVNIDGILDDDAWNSAVSIKNFRTPKLNEKPTSKTTAWLCWDQDFLYVAFEAFDNDLIALYENHDDLVFKDDVLEVFCQPVPGQMPYFNIETNINEAFLDQSSDGGIPWNFEGLKLASSYKGTLNKNNDRDQKWILELAIPFKEAPGAGGKAPEKGDQWKFHLARYDYSKYLKTSPELSSIAPLQRVNFHQPEDWVTLTFLEGSP